MPKSRGLLQSASKVVILLFLGVAALLLTTSIFMLVFVPLVGAYIWDANDKLKVLEARLAMLEKPAQATKPEQA
ncbi:MAG: hypothetical protein OK438_04990 [Thaumarchaeota archaeon]|nr:hypothetical protein [Nitrososphaerota archaeon]